MSPPACPTRPHPIAGACPRRRGLCRPGSPSAPAQRTPRVVCPCRPCPPQLSPTDRDAPGGGSRQRSLTRLMSQAATSYRCTCETCGGSGGQGAGSFLGETGGRREGHRGAADDRAKRGTFFTGQKNGFSYVTIILHFFRLLSNKKQKKDMLSLPDTKTENIKKTMQ